MQYEVGLSSQRVAAASPALLSWPSSQPCRVHCSVSALQSMRSSKRDGCTAGLTTQTRDLRRDSVLLRLWLVRCWPLHNTLFALQPIPCSYCSRSRQDANYYSPPTQGSQCLGTNTMAQLPGEKNLKGWLRWPGNSCTSRTRQVRQADCESPCWQRDTRS